MFEEDRQLNSEICRSDKDKAYGIFWGALGMTIRAVIVGRGFGNRLAEVEADLAFDVFRELRKSQYRGEARLKTYVSEIAHNRMGDLVDELFGSTKSVEAISLDALGEEKDADTVKPLADHQDPETCLENVIGDWWVSLQKKAGVSAFSATVLYERICREMDRTAVAVLHDSTPASISSVYSQDRKKLEKVRPI